MSNLDHIPSDDPPGADSSPMSERQRNALGWPVEYMATQDELENTDHMIASCKALLAKLEEKRLKLHARLVDFESKPGIPAKPDPADVSTALAEHTAPALTAIEQAAQRELSGLVDGLAAIAPALSPRREVCPLCLEDGATDNHEAHHAEPVKVTPAEFRAAAEFGDPFAGIPNADDSDNWPL